eukprot:jgi/Picsp_1/308/NSC_00307-R1_short-chain dehydrogenase reductase sdr
MQAGGSTYRTALVTGAAQGIGLAIAETLVSTGVYRVMMADVQAEELQRAKNHIVSTVDCLVDDPDRVDTVVCDVTNKTQVDEMVQNCIDRFGALHVCVANAGIVKSADFLQLAEQDFDSVIAVNLKGVFLTCQSAARAMISTQQPASVSESGLDSSCSIITMSSMNAVTAIPNITSYNASKGGVNNLTRNMALSLAKNNIRVNAVAPGSVMTDMLRKVAHDRDVMRSILSRTPMQRIADPKEIANVVKFLASPDASYITGQIVYVDGGRSTLNYVNPVDEHVLDSLTSSSPS